jgi:hypothetical protein
MMDVMKKVLFVTAVTAIVFAAGCYSANPHGKYCQRRYFLTHIGRETANLKLPDVQQKKFSEMRDTTCSDRESARKDRNNAKMIIHEELAKICPDMMKKSKAEHSEFIENHMDSFLAFYNMLDENQQTLILEKI